MPIRAFEPGQDVTVWAETRPLAMLKIVEVHGGVVTLEDGSEWIEKNGESIEGTKRIAHTTQRDLDLRNRKRIVARVRELVSYLGWGERLSKLPLPTLVMLERTVQQAVTESVNRTYADRSEAARAALVEQELAKLQGRIDRAKSLA